MLTAETLAKFASTSKPRRRGVTDPLPVVAPVAARPSTAMVVVVPSVAVAVPAAVVLPPSRRLRRLAVKG